MESDQFQFVSSLKLNAMIIKIKLPQFSSFLLFLFAKYHINQRFFLLLLYIHPVRLDCDVSSSDETPPKRIIEEQIKNQDFV